MTSVGIELYLHCSVSSTAEDRWRVGCDVFDSLSITLSIADCCVSHHTVVDLLF